MTSKTKTPVAMRVGEPLQIGREIPYFGRNIVAKRGLTFETQHRLFVNDPWELIAEAIHRAVPAGRVRTIAHSFRRQAEDYFRAATIGRELTVRPVLLYYAFLNLSKAYIITKGNLKLVERAYHGVTARAKTGAVLGSLITFDRTRREKVFHELVNYLGGNPAVVNSELRLGYLLPQILPGHRLWCYATSHLERFLTVERFDLLHAPVTREVWLTLHVNRAEIERLGMSDAQVLSRSDFLKDFEIAQGMSPRHWTCFQQRLPESYRAEPAQALIQILAKTQDKIWETVRTESPYRKPYIYCSQSSERKARMPQLLSIYLLMFFLGHVTRYSPGYFEDILDSKFGPFFGTFLSESPTQFLYLMASEILGREVTKPAII